MPHCLIEYSQNLSNKQPVQNLLEAVFNGVVQSGLFEHSHIRVRAIAFADFLLASPDESFIHVTIRLHQGRNPEQRKQLSSSVLHTLLTLDLNKAAITVETVEIDTPSYSKQYV